MTHYKMMQHDERRAIALPAEQATSTITTLWRASLLSDRRYLSEEAMIKILLENPGRLTMEGILEAPEDPELDVVAFRDIDGVVDSIREAKGDMVHLGFVLSLFARKGRPHTEAAEEEDPALAELMGDMGEMPSEVIEAGPLRFAMERGTEIPPGASRSDPLTEAQATNLYNLYWTAMRSIDEGRKHFGMSAPLEVADVSPVEERNRDRSIFLLRMRGHHIRERIPGLGYNCCPLSEHLDFLETLILLYTELIKKNTGIFFRYPLMYKKFQELFRNELVALARQKRRGQVPEDQKIRILDVGVSTGDEPISIALTAAICFEKHRNQLRNILGKDPGHVRDWVEIVGTEKEARYSEDIQEFLMAARYPNALKTEIPTQYLEAARRHGFMVEEADHFSFSPDIMDLIQIHFVNFFNPATMQNPILKGTVYDFMFYIKVLEYIITDPSNIDEAGAGQVALGMLDSGALLKNSGILITDGDMMRPGWTTMTQQASVQGMLMAAMRRSGLPGVEQVAGPVQTTSDDPLALFDSGEVMFPMTAQTLDPYTFKKVPWQYPMDEIEIFRCLGRYRTATQREIAEVTAQLKQLRKALTRSQKAVRKGRGRGMMLMPSTSPAAAQAREELRTEIARLEARLRELRKQGGDE